MLFGGGFRYCQTPLQLANPTQLQLVGVGVDFVFPQEGRRRKEGTKNPHLASSSWIGPRSLNFGNCLMGVWKVFGNLVEGVWHVSVDYLEGVFWVSGMCLEGGLRVSGGNLWDV